MSWRAKYDQRTIPASSGLHAKVKAAAAIRGQTMGQFAEEILGPVADRVCWHQDGSPALDAALAAWDATAGHVIAASRGEHHERQARAAFEAALRGRL